VSLKFFFDIILSAALWPWGWLSLLTGMNTRNDSWVVKVAGAYGHKPYHIHPLSVLKSGSLSLLEPYELVQACNGIAFTKLAGCYKVSFAENTPGRLLN
jgi:hypothetical protein